MGDADAELARRIGTSIGEHRRAANMSQATLAERLDVSVDYVSRLERGQRMPAVPVLVRVASTLAVTLDELVSGSVEAKQDAWKRAAIAALEPLPKDTRALVMAMIEAASAKATSQRRGAKGRARL